MFYVYCIKVSQGVKGTDEIVYRVPNGYEMFEELRGYKYGETSQIVYERTGIYRTEKKEYSRIIKCTQCQGLNKKERPTL